MRVVGFTRGEVSTVLLGEIGLFTFLALPFGCGMGALMSWGLIQGLGTENYRIPFIIEGNTFAFACSIVVSATVMSAWLVQRKISNLDLLSVLKTKE